MKDPEALLRSVLDVGECILPGGRRPGAPARWPSVFVHGLLGWGGKDALSKAEQDRPLLGSGLRRRAALFERERV